MTPFPRPSPFLRTASGRDLILARPDAVCIDDIAAHLAKINRFNGASRQPYSVAQHSVLVATILAVAGHDAATQLWGLLHDAHEAYLGDMATPVQWHVFGNIEQARNVLLSAWEEATDAMDDAIIAAFGLTVTSVMRHDVALADKRAFVTEWRDLMPGPCPAGWTAEPAPDPVWPAEHWRAAAAVFLHMFHHLTTATQTAALR